MENKKRKINASPEMSQLQMMEQTKQKRTIERAEKANTSANNS
jgi:hypothetical protein